MDQASPAHTAEVRLYTLAGCAACGVARRLLRRRGITFDEIRGEGITDFRRMLRRRTGSATVPQVVIDGRPIGGADSLIALDRSGVLRVAGSTALHSCLPSGHRPRDRRQRPPRGSWGSRRRGAGRRRPG
ncbi:MAG: hypothetical protein JJE23_07910 [Thermoleophilia bacterium]|nr:hypothetical protein [Thermoleophilia bacterium]